MATRQPKWANEENAAAIALYLVMRSKVDKGVDYNKAAMIRKTQNGDFDGLVSDNMNGPLALRSRGSIEAKLMNITAVLHDLGRDDISMTDHGYRPLSNYQADLRTICVGLLAVRDEAVAGGFSA